LQRSAPTENERELNDNVNVNASEADKEASGAAATQTETESPTGRNSALKIKQAKKKTSPVWKHFNEIFLEENVLPGFESRFPRITQARVRLATNTLPQTPHSAGALCTGYALIC